MGSIEKLFELFTNGIWGFVQAGSSAVESGSAVANGVYGQAIGSIGKIVGGL